MCCSYGNGNYAASLNGVVVASGGEFESSESTNFGAGCVPAEVWEEIFFEDFESGFGNFFLDGGADASINMNHAYAGAKSLRLRDNTSSSLAKTTTYDVSAYSQLEVSFFFYAISMEVGEDFWLQIKADGGNWQTVQAWVSGSDFQNESAGWYSENVIFDSSSMSTIKLRFKCDATGDGDKIFIDDVTFKGLLA